MKKIIFGLCLAAGVLLNLTGQAQSLVDEYAEVELERVRQLPGSEKCLKDYFGSLEGVDTVYALIYPVSNCPRCEPSMLAVYDRLKRHKTKPEVVCVAVYPDSLAAKQYQENLGYNIDNCIYDTTQGYRNFLSFSIGFFHVPYLLKCSLKEGKLIVGMRAGYSLPELIDGLIAYNEPKPQTAFPAMAELSPKFHAKEAYLQKTATYTINAADSIALSEVIYRPQFVGRNLCFNDKLRNAIEWFETDDANQTLQQRGEIRVTAEERKAFSNVSDEDFDYMLRHNELKFIANNLRLFKDTLFVSHSLPNLSYSFYGDARAVSYMNSACVLKYNLCDNSRKLIQLNIDPYGELFYSHFEICNNGNEIVTGCEPLTWPSGFDREDYENIPKLDPFKREFYQFERPIFASFSSESGDLIGHSGRLPELSEQTLTGYCFIAPILDGNGRDCAYSDGFSGKISVARKESIDQPFEEYQIFDPGQLPEPDPGMFYSYEIRSLYAPYLCRSIKDIKITDSHVYALIHYGIKEQESATDAGSFVTINRQNGQIDELQFPRLSGETLAYGLRLTADNAVQPYAIEKSQNGWRLHIYE